MESLCWWSCLHQQNPEIHQGTEWFHSLLPAWTMHRGCGWSGGGGGKGVVALAQWFLKLDVWVLLSCFLCLYWHLSSLWPCWEIKLYCWLFITMQMFIWFIYVSCPYQHLIAFKITTSSYLLYFCFPKVPWPSSIFINICQLRLHSMYLIRTTTTQETLCQIKARILLVFVYSLSNLPWLIEANWQGAGVCPCQMPLHNKDVPPWFVH